MTITAKVGTFRARVLAALFGAVNWILPGTVITELQCVLCGEIVDPANTDQHLAFFHPDEA